MRQFNYEALAYKKWDMDILTLVAKIHECKGREDLFIRQKPAELERLLKIAKVQSTEASNRIEGIVTTSTRLKQLVDEKTTPRNRAESEIVGYRNVLNTIHKNFEYIPVHPSYILQLHRDLLKPAGLSYAGQFKNVQNYIKEIRSDGTEFIRFTPVAPYETKAAVEALCESYSTAVAKEIIDPLILMSVFICDFLCIHPFNDGNGRMSRLITLLLLYKSGYRVGKYVSIESEIEKTKDRYYDVLEVADARWHEAKNDVTPFVRYMLQVILACYGEFEERAGVFRDNDVKSTSYNIVKNFVESKIGKFNSAEVLAQCPTVGRSSALAALKTLTNEGKIIKIGSGKKTFYVRSDSFTA